MARDPSIVRTSLRGRLTALLCVFLILVGACGALSAVMVRSWSSAIDERGELRNAASDVSDLRLAYSDQETGIRGYQLSGGDPDTLAPYREGAGIARQLIARLDERPIDEIDLRPLLDAVTDSTETWRRSIAEPTIEDPAAAPSAEAGKATFDRVRGELDLLDAAVTSALDRLVAHTSDVRRNTFTVLIASFAVALAATIAAALLFRRWVLEPLAAISRAASDLEHDPTDVHLPDFEVAELQAVTDAIRTMQRSLADARDQAIVAYEGLEQSAVLALHVRSQLANDLGQLPEGWSIDSMLEPATGVVAGDCYDVGLLDPNTVYLVMVDVTGHGAVPALDALKAKSQLRAALRSKLAPGAAIEWMSRERQGDPSADLMTAIVAKLDLATGDCHYANAGHPPMLVVDHGGATPFERTGPLIGAFPATWQTKLAHVPRGASLVIYTDGVTDALGEDRTRFGEERLLATLTGVSESPTEAIRAVRGAIEDFRVGPQYDDVTMIVVGRDAA